VRKINYVLDSYALLAYFQAEPAGAKVKDLLKKVAAGDTLVFMSMINMGEIIYITGRKLGNNAAMDIYRDLLRLPIHLAEVTVDSVLAAANVKANYPISYADAFAVALAQQLNATVVTGDPEFKRVESLVHLLWI
jgi:ribonuclease VapC